MDCSSYWECVFGDYSHNFTYSTNGNADSTLTLNATLPPNPKSKNQNKPFLSAQRPSIHIQPSTCKDSNHLILAII